MSAGALVLREFLMSLPMPNLLFLYRKTVKISHNLAFGRREKKEVFVGHHLNLAVGRH